MSISIYICLLNKEEYLAKDMLYLSYWFNGEENEELEDYWQTQAMLVMKNLDKNDRNNNIFVSGSHLFKLVFC